mgnify:CR=1 FL=1
MHTEHVHPFKELGEGIEQIGKTLVMFICLTVAFNVAGFFALWAFGHFWIAIIVGLFVTAPLVPNFLVSVPEITGLITINALTGSLDTYATGLHLRYPWEQVKLGNYINLRQVTEEIEETYPALDALMHVKWIFQYTPLVRGLPQYISADDNSIKSGLRGTGSSVLAEQIGSKKGEDAKKSQEAIEKALKLQFVEGSNDFTIARYGIRLDRVEIADLDFDPSVQAARSAMAEADITVKIAEKFRMGKEVTDKDALNAAQVERGKADKKIIDIESLTVAGLTAAARALGEAIRGGK